MSESPGRSHPLKFYHNDCRYRHAADKLQKTENVMEKYKKKLQEGADLRQHVKVR
jgi:hypothetical protein